MRKEGTARLGIAQGAALVVLTLVAYLPAWPGGFLVEDWPFLERYRQWSVAETIRFELGRPLKNRAWVERERPEFFSTALWRPLPYILAHLEQRAFDDWTGGWFLTRLACHAGTAWLFAVAVLAWTRQRDLACMAGAFYALHPSRFYSLLVMCQSQMLLAAFGAVLALWGLGVWRQGLRRGAVAAVAGAAIACWSYEQAVAVIVLWPVLDALMPGPDGPRPAGRIVARRALAIVVPVVCYAVLRIVRFEGFGGYTSLVEGTQLFDPAHPLTLLRGAAVSTGSALVSLVAPISGRDWQLRGSPGDAVSALPVALNVVIAGATAFLVAWRSRGRRRQSVLGAVALVVFVTWTVLPVAGLLGGHVPWNRYVYFPGMAWVVVLAWAVRPGTHGVRGAIPAAVALGGALVLAWWGCTVWRAAWTQAHGLRAALDNLVPENDVAYVYLENFSEWVGGRNLFIRNLTGPIDVGKDADRLRLWPAHWPAPADSPIPVRTTWPFARPPLVRLGIWNPDTVALTLETPPAYEPGGPDDRQLWDLRTHAGRAGWMPDPLMTPVRGGPPGLHVRVGSPFGMVDGPPWGDLGWTPAVLGIDMTTWPSVNAPDWLEVLFFTANQPTAAATHILRSATVADGRPHQYVIALLDHPVPALDGPLTGIAIRPSRQVGARVLVRTIWIAAAAAAPGASPSPTAPLPARTRSPAR